MSSKQPRRHENSTPWDRVPRYFMRQALAGITDNAILEGFLFDYLGEHEFNSFMEVGCAMGTIYGILREKYGKSIEDKYFGMDIAKTSITIAQILHPGGWFKWSDVRDYEFIQKYDIVYSSEVLSHIRLEDIKPIIKKLINAAKNACFFSLKYSDEGELQHEVIVKELPSYYSFNNLVDILTFIRKCVPEDMVLKYQKVPGFNKSFIKGTKWHGITGNLNVQITKKEGK